MIIVDAPGTLLEWSRNWEPRWRRLSIEAGLRLPEKPAINKAVVTLETESHVASVTVWGSGTLEFIVLELATQREVIMMDKEYRTARELLILLDDCAGAFSSLVRTT